MVDFNVTESGGNLFSSIEYKPLSELTKGITIGVNPRRFFQLNPPDATGFYVTVRELDGLNGVKQYAQTDSINKEALQVINSRANPQAGDLLFSNTGTVGKMALVDGAVENWGVNEGIFVIKPDHEQIMSKFLYYYLSSSHAYRDYSRRFTGATLKHLSQSGLLETNIPVPSLERQKRIVQILDEYSEKNAQLIETLTTELEARKVQYEYYRSKLLNSNSCNPATTLGEICRFVRGPFGGSLKKSMFVESGYPVYEQQHAIHGGYDFRYFVDEDKYFSMKRFAVAPGDLIMSCSGTIGKISIIANDAPIGIINQALLKLTPHKDVDAQYLAYYFESYISMLMNSSARGGAIKNVATVSELKMIEINLPTIAEQRSLVKRLDAFRNQFEDYCNAIGKEIQLRKTQYEYYRDKLLSFQKVS